LEGGAGRLFAAQVERKEIVEEREKEGEGDYG